MTEPGFDQSAFLCFPAPFLPENPREHLWPDGKERIESHAWKAPRVLTFIRMVLILMTFCCFFSFTQPALSYFVIQKELVSILEFI